ncbi:MAG: NADH:flavin oxidoreductase, partial [Bacteroidetes bacterium]|nr:NADH:flavin oxidoreductase [Bacteroidota bacterium]
MTRESYRLFSEGKIRNLTITNRLVRSATAEGGMTEEGRLIPGLLEFYERLTAGGAGMIITGHMAVMPQGRAGHNQGCIWDDEYIEDIAQMADQVHRTDESCRVIAQLSHCGRQKTAEDPTGDCTGPSAVPSPILERTARELSNDEIEEVIECFVQAMSRVKKAGFDGVQLHAAHGWLLSSFLSPYTNLRNDEFGGSLENRMRILAEIVTRGRALVGDFPILVKINCDDFILGGVDINLFQQHVDELAKFGVDAVEISGGMWDCLARDEDTLGFFPIIIPESRVRINKPEKQSYFLKYLKGIISSIPIILVGGNKNVENLEDIVKNEKVDFISMSRPFISEPELPNRWKRDEGSEKADCTSCNMCILTVREGLTNCMLKNDKAR